MATYEEQLENLLREDIGAVKERERDAFAVPPHRLRTEVSA